MIRYRPVFSLVMRENYLIMFKNRAQTRQRLYLQPAWSQATSKVCRPSGCLQYSFKQTHLKRKYISPRLIYPENFSKARPNSRDRCPVSPSEVSRITAETTMATSAFTIPHHGSDICSTTYEVFMNRNPGFSTIVVYENQFIASFFALDMQLLIIIKL